HVGWDLTDHLGSTRTVVDNGGHVLDTITYDVFGAMTQSNATNEPIYLYTGRNVDPTTGLQFNRGRWEDLVIHRWMSEDPIGFNGGDSNLYRYVHNAPTNSTDPSGLDEIIIRGTDVIWNVEKKGAWRMSWDPDLQDARIG